MALKAKLANKPVTDDNGYVSAELICVEFQDSDENDFEQEQFCFNFNVPGSQKDILMRLWTGTKINPDKFTEGKKSNYNKLTRVCLALGLIDPASLPNVSAEECQAIDLEGLAGSKVKFKLQKSIKAKGLNVIDIDSLAMAE